MVNISDSGDTLRCSFCNKTQKQVAQLIAGPQIYICDECVEICAEIIAERVKSESDAQPQELQLVKPRETAEFLDKFVIGQDRAKRALAVAVYTHYKRLQLEHTILAEPDKSAQVEIAKSNVLLIGPTGTGKTYLAQALAKQLNVPFTIADATSLTEAGYAGEDVESILAGLLRAADYDVAKAERGIVYIDEIDKIARKANNGPVARDITGEGVQHALLKIIEGTTASVPPDGGRKMPDQERVSLNTRNILFIVAGAFTGLDEIVQKRLGRGGIGFGAQIGDTVGSAEVYERIEPEDLHKFGLIPELIGRLPVITSVDPLDEKSLVKILTEPQNALVKQYQHLFEMDGVELEFTQDALKAVAASALARGTGARGLRSIMERVLEPVMFHAPSDESIVKVLITEDVVSGSGQPRVMRKKRGTKKAAAGSA